MSEEFDIDTFNIVKDAMEGDVVDLIDVYIRNSANYVDAVVQAFKDGDYTAVADAAHPLKSSSASLGAIRVSEVASEIEKRCDGGRVAPNSEDSLKKLIAQLPELFENAKNFLNSSIQDLK